jgi:hypothetical protein
MHTTAVLWPNGWPCKQFVWLKRHRHMGTFHFWTWNTTQYDQQGWKEHNNYTCTCKEQTFFMTNVWNSSLNVFDNGAVLLQSIFWTLSIVSMFCNHQQRLARSIRPNRVGSPDDKGRAIPWNVVVAKHRDDG